MRIAVIALKNAAAANINTSSVTRLNHSSLSRSVILISLESLPKFVNDFFARIYSSVEQSPPKGCATQFKNACSEILPILRYTRGTRHSCRHRRSCREGGDPVRYGLR